MGLNSILEKYRSNSFSERDKGNRFERLMQAFLLTDPRYAGQFKNVWMWDEFPGRNDLGGKDTGIDLVAFTHENEYWAIQCKFYQESTAIDKASVDSFLSTSSRTFKDENSKTTGFSQRLWISTSNNWGSCNPLTANLLFNLELAKQPLECVEYVVAHELAHLLERTHNGIFQALLNQHLPNWRILKERLAETPIAVLNVESHG